MVNLFFNPYATIAIVPINVASDAETSEVPLVVGDASAKFNQF